MIPIDEQLLPDFIKRGRRPRIIMTVIVLLVIVGGVYGYLIIIRDSLQKGVDHTDMDNAIAERMFDSLAIGLEQYYRAHGYYPQIEGKYFLDSIKQYIHLNAFIYSDSIAASRDTIVVEWGNVDFSNRSRTYLGIGRHEQTILYAPLSHTSYRLIYVGTNGIDENGDGDDLVYEKD